MGGLVLSLPKLGRSSVDAVHSRSLAYVLTLWLAVAGVSSGLLLTGASVKALYIVGLLAICAAIGERGRVEVGPNLSMSISLVPMLFAAVLFGPIASMIVAAASFLPEFRQP